jgi:hypothetical protein
MKYRKVILLVSTCLIAVISLVILFWSPGDFAPVVQKNKPVFTEEKQAKLKAIMAVYEQAEAVNDVQQQQVAFDGFVEELGGRAGKMLRMARDRNLPVKMYGRVIDQHGQPVAGAKVQMVISGGGTFAPGTGRTYFVTDEDGLFEVSGKGQEIHIFDIEHPQLSAVYLKYPGMDLKRKSVSLDAVGAHGEETSWETYNSPDNPYVIPVWRVEKFEKVKVDTGRFHPLPDGMPSKRATRFGIVATCVRDPKIADLHWRKQTGSWAVTFKPIDGGIQETNDFYLNEAPEGGYQSEFTVSMEKGIADYKVATNKPKYLYYYYMEKGKRIYGSLEVTFEPYLYNDECHVTIKQYKLNLSGSRNLATRMRRY